MKVTPFLEPGLDAHNAFRKIVSTWSKQYGEQEKNIERSFGDDCHNCANHLATG